MCFYCDLVFAAVTAGEETELLVGLKNDGNKHKFSYVIGLPLSLSAMQCYVQNVFVTFMVVLCCCIPLKEPILVMWLC